MAGLRISSHRLLVVLLLLFIIALIAVPRAQAQYYPLNETYFGFSFYSSGYGTERNYSPGLQFSTGFNFHPNIRLVADMGVQVHGTDAYIENGKVKLREYQFLFGPEFVARNHSTVTPFAHFLVGYSTRHYNVGNNVYYCNSFFNCSEGEDKLAADSGFTWASGGGIDIDALPGVSIRAIQFDFVRANLKPDRDLIPTTGILLRSTGWQNNYRISVGVTLRLGQRGRPRR